MPSSTLAIFLLTSFVVYRFLSLIINRYLWNKFSILKDIHLLSKARSKKVPGVAIVCGGSIAGLFAARVCANHFNKVIIVEPEEWVADCGKSLKSSQKETTTPKRSRVAQYTAFHHFQVLITTAMSEMFGSQNLKDAVRSVGGRLLTHHIVYWISGFSTLVPSGFPYISVDGSIAPQVISLTRPAFETVLRRLVLDACKEVQYFHGTVTGLMHDEINNRVTGVNAKLPDGDSVELEGNIVIGAFMGGFRWLKEIPALSNRSPSLDDLKLTYNPNVSYTTCEFALPPKLEQDLRKYRLPTDQDNDSAMYGFIPGRDTDNKILFMEKREKNLLHITCGGYGWSKRMQSLSDIEEFAEGLNWKNPKPAWIEVLQALQQHNVPGTFVHSKFGGCVYIKYHEATSYLPSNFIVVGDAQSQTNPSLGQGTPKACANAIILNAQLHRSIEDSNGVLQVSRDFAKKYYLEAKNRTEHIWLGLKGLDYDFNTTVPLPSEDLQKTSRFFRNYGRIFSNLTGKDADLSGTYYRQSSWLEPPTQLMAPWIMRRVIWAWLRRLIIGNETL